ncbi:MAG TPA: single-stranded DNA-binding protein [Limnobacter sp.]|nr:single-stranded DNA-binding protein [Limnobacter sp.]
MSRMVGVFRLGQDVDLRYTPSGTAAANLSLAYNYGQRDGEGKRPTQWVDATLYGKLAEALAPYLLKGSTVFAVISDMHIETYQRRDQGVGTKLTGTVLALDLLSSGAPSSDAKSHAANQESAHRPQRQASPPSAGTRPSTPSRPPQSVMDMDDDIPF